MESNTVWQTEDETMDRMPLDAQAERTESASNIKNLRDLTLRLLREVQSMGEVHTVNLEGGLDFYEEVGRFEVDLIKRALLQTAGHQGRAARLLNLKVTTLNSKIKHYNLSLNDFSSGYPLVQSGPIERNQAA